MAARARGEEPRRSDTEQRWWRWRRFAAKGKDFDGEVRRHGKKTETFPLRRKPFGPDEGGIGRQDCIRATLDDEAGAGAIHPAQAVLPDAEPGMAGKIQPDLAMLPAGRWHICANIRPASRPKPVDAELS